LSFILIIYEDGSPELLFIAVKFVNLLQEQSLTAISLWCPWITTQQQQHNYLLQENVVRYSNIFLKWTNRERWSCTPTTHI